jgi:uncharacterized membrane protein YeaQ/YmgE (transglycosylase-associated protein family)
MHLQSVLLCAKGLVYNSSRFGFFNKLVLGLNGANNGLQATNQSRSVNMHAITSAYIGSMLMIRNE